MNDFYVLVDHNKKMIIDHIKKLPENWRNIHGLSFLEPRKIYRLDWAGQIGLGWINTREEKLKEYSYLPEWFEVSKNGLKDYISSERWKKETDVLIFKGNSIKIDERTKLALHSKMIRLDDSIEEVSWKFQNGFVSLTKSEFISLYNFCIDYIQKCFDEELRLIQMCDLTNTFEEFVKKDFTANWPSTNYD